MMNYAEDFFEVLTMQPLLHMQPICHHRCRCWKQPFRSRSFGSLINELADVGMCLLIFKLGKKMI